MTRPAPSCAAESDRIIREAARQRPRDLLDVAGLCGELGITLRFCGRGLSLAWELAAEYGDRADGLARARWTALRTLREAQRDLARVIAELEALSTGEDW